MWEIEFFIHFKLRASILRIKRSIAKGKIQVNLKCKNDQRFTLGGLHPHGAPCVDVSRKITGQCMSSGNSDVSLNILLDVEHLVSLWKVDKGLLNFFICFTSWRKFSPRECKCQTHFIIGSGWIQIGIQFINQFSKLSYRGDYVIPDLSKSNSPVSQCVRMIHEEIIRHWCSSGNSCGHQIYFSQY